MPESPGARPRARGDAAEEARRRARRPRRGAPLRAGGGPIDELIRVDLPGAAVAFSTRLGGVSEGPYESLNLGILTDDDRGSGGAEPRAPCAAAGLDPASIAMGWQVHGTDVKEWDAPPERRSSRRWTPTSPVATTSRCSCWWRTACRSRWRAAAASRWSTAAGAAWRAASSRARSSISTSRRRRPSARASALLLRGRRRGARGSSTARFADGRMLDLRAIADALLRAAGVERGRARRPVHELPGGPVLLAPARRRRDRPPGRARVADLDPARVRANLERVRERIGDEVEICAAIKYVDGRRSAGARRGGDHARRREPRTGPRRRSRTRTATSSNGTSSARLQSRKVKDVAPRVRLIHSVASESALAQLEKHPAQRGAGPGERGGGGGQGGDRAGGARGLRRPLPVARCRPDDDAAASPRTRRTAGPTSRGSPSSPPSTG